MEQIKEAFWMVLGVSAAAFGVGCAIGAFTGGIALAMVILKAAGEML